MRCERIALPTELRPHRFVGIISRLRAGVNSEWPFRLLQLSGIIVVFGVVEDSDDGLKGSQEAVSIIDGSDCGKPRSRDENGSGDARFGRASCCLQGHHGWRSD